MQAEEDRRPGGVQNELQCINCKRSAAPARPASRQTNQPEMAIVKYRTVHTGAKSQFGGRQVGFANRSYQSPGRNSAPVRAAKKQAAMKPRSPNTEKCP